MNLSQEKASPEPPRDLPSLYLVSYNHVIQASCELAHLYPHGFNFHRCQVLNRLPLL